MRFDYSLHCLRAFRGRYEPLSYAQFVALRGRIWSARGTSGAAA